MDTGLLKKVKAQNWFYEFPLPDRSVTIADIGKEAGLIHTSRCDKLREVISTEVPNATELTALEFASHQDYFHESKS